ncbi:hypothetical protein PPSIR1_08277 [Plesiocystis pacifica SIR-1]|uniref:Uncharacterized protein n=1 Tax=Plesiocystis pacifica SIR-1 TaxID=391625 RepID=A6GE30_9BACT|nr:hypothetical protein PPSIR1_08277 [Plesiocystis pacifica SIR-1]
MPRVAPSRVIALSKGMEVALSEGGRS